MKKIFSVALALMLVFSLSLSAFAFEIDGVKYPDFVKAYNGNSYSLSGFGEYVNKSNVLLFHDVSTGSLKLLFADGTLYCDDGVNVYGNGTTHITEASLGDGIWNQSAVSTYNSSKPLIAVEDLSMTMQDIKSQDGSRVVIPENFPAPPLAEQVQEVTGQVMLEEAVEVTRTMGLLTVSGIGLMALLIGLALFGKRSLISLR